MAIVVLTIVGPLCLIFTFYTVSSGSSHAMNPYRDVNFQINTFLEQM